MAQLEHHSHHPFSGNVSLLTYPLLPPWTAITTETFFATTAAVKTDKVTSFGYGLVHSPTTTVVATPPSSPTTSSSTLFSASTGHPSSLITTNSYGTTVQSQIPSTTVFSSAQLPHWPHPGAAGITKPAIGDFKPGGDQFCVIVGILVVGVVVLSACVVSLSICRRRQRRRDRDVRDLAEDDEEAHGSDGSSVQEIVQPHHDSTLGRYTWFLTSFAASAKQGLVRRFGNGERANADGDATQAQEKGKRCRSCGKLLGNERQGHEERRITGTPIITPEVEDSVAWQREVCLDCAVRGSGITNRLRCRD